MCQAHLARLWRLASTDKRHLRSKVVRCSERTLSHQTDILTQLSRHGVYFGRLDSLLQRHWRHNSRHTASQHSLSRARSANHQHIMASGCGNLQGTLHIALALHIGKVLDIEILLLRILRHLANGRSNINLVIQVGDNLFKTLYRNNLDTLDNGRLVSTSRRNDNAA